jgi:hypothetical protein
MAFTNRTECIRAWNRFKGDPEFFSKLMAGDIETRNAKGEIDAYLQSQRLKIVPLVVV